jgi:hypothetical protein
MITSDVDSENKTIVRVRQLASIQCGRKDECMYVWTVVGVGDDKKVLF